MTEQDWDAVLEDHRRAIAEFVAKAEVLPEDRWTVPRDEGKWSPADEAEHLVHAYRGMVRSLEESIEIPILLPRWKVLLARWLHLPKILRGQFPRGAVAPRPTRPRGDFESRVEALEALQRYARSFEEAISHAHQSKPDGTMNHPYFGALSFARYLQLNAQHTRHHGRHLPSP